MIAASLIHVSFQSFYTLNTGTGKKRANARLLKKWIQRSGNVEQP